MQTVTNLYETDCIQSKSICDCLDAGCLPPDDLCNQFVIKGGRSASGQLQHSQAATYSSQLPKKKKKVNQ